MIYKFLMLSDEVDDFVREISIASEATFFELHNAILDAVNYEKDQITSFFLCSEDWEKEQEITLMEMDSGSEYDNLVMDETVLDEYVSDEGQKLLYVFDYISDRAFFIELKEMLPSKYLEKPICSISQGEPPVQMQAEEDLVAAFSPNVMLDESFFGDDGFDADELDEDGFSGLEGEISSIDELEI